MHLVIGGIVGLDGQEGAGADVQRDEMAFDAGAIERIEQPGREMQAGCRRGDGAFLTGIDRLVVLAVALVLGALGGDIGRQRNMADGGDRLVERRS